MQIEYREVDTWDELMNYINDSFISYPDYIFRGQCQDNWKIESSLTRLLRESELDRDFDVFYNQQLSNFKLKSRGLGLDLKKMNDDEIWAIGQHYGLATPLIDWTTSPYIAVFFAIIGAAISETGKRVIWAFNLPDLNNFKTEDRNLISLIEPLDDNRRLINQRGLFLKLPIDDDFENIISNQPEQDWISLFKITFPDSIIKTAILGLDLMNINFSSIFPDLYGAGLACNYNLKLYNHIYDLREEEDKDYL
ncbi:MAG: hypothetical protein RLZZ540_1206 [Bacteroidota bacterium]|jgi:hypothetical protein